MSNSKTKHKSWTDEKVERACRLFLQDMWNDQSEVQVLSPDGKEIILGGILGIEINKHWLKIKKYLNQSPDKKGKV